MGSFLAAETDRRSCFRRMRSARRGWGGNNPRRTGVTWFWSRKRVLWSHASHSPAPQPTARQTANQYPIAPRTRNAAPFNTFYRPCCSFTLVSQAQRCMLAARPIKRYSFAERKGWRNLAYAQRHGYGSWNISRSTRHTRGDRYEHEGHVEELSNRSSPIYRHGHRTCSHGLQVRLRGLQRHSRQLRGRNNPSRARSGLYDYGPKHGFNYLVWWQQPCMGA